MADQAGGSAWHKVLVKGLGWTVKRPLSARVRMAKSAHAELVSILYSVAASMKPHPIALSRFREPPSTPVGANVPDARTI
jgi:hypothetical protein